MASKQKVFLLSDVESVGMAGELIEVADGYASNFLFPRKLAVEVTPQNEAGFLHRVRKIEDRKAVVATKTSMLAEKVKSLKLEIAAKVQDAESASGKLYGAVSAAEIVAALALEGVAVAKSQILFDKAIKTIGTHTVTVKLSNALQPQFSLKVVAQ